MSSTSETASTFLVHDALDAQPREPLGSVVLGHRNQYIKYLSFISSTYYRAYGSM